MLRHIIKIFFFIALLASFLFSVAAYAAGSEGDWSFTYDCSKATGFYKERCEEGIRDSFRLYSVTRQGDRICASSLASWQLGNHVDECDGVCVCGTVKKNTAVVSFDSTWMDTPGKAKITYNPHTDTLTWTLITPPKGGGDSGYDTAWWFPDHAVLKRDHRSKRHTSRPLDCAKCAAE